MGNMIAGTKIVMLLISGVIIIPIQLINNAFFPRFAMRLPIHYHGFLLWLIGLKVQVKGELPGNEPAIYVSNHAGYIDVPVLGSLVEGFFVARADLARWPFFGPLSRAGRTLFVDRTRRSQARQHVDMLTERLDKGESIFFFPEGTSNDGTHIQPFKSTLMSAAELQLEDGQTPLVRPISIAYVGVYGLRTGRREREIYAWYGDTELVPHLWQLFQIGAGEVVVWFHEPVRASDFPTRKELTQHCEKVIRTHSAMLLAGRETPAA
ncbi:MAG: 1-acyl-sn-glycerol-3-phosphate acyltransferase [Alphaproteobacteria bacterium]|nr:MAG: 1-acyl-sn-glycerol-3-phosphate acyltransferase [Alphaproteobacteria bacterium]